MLKSEKINHYSFSAAMLFTATVLLAMLVMSVGIKQPLWNVAYSKIIPFLLAIPFSLMAVLGIYSYCFFGGRQKRVGRLLLIYFISSVAMLYLANVGFFWSLGHQLIQANPFMPLWITSVYPVGVQLLQWQWLAVSSIVAYGLVTALLIYKHWEYATQQGAHFQSHAELTKNGHFKSQGFPVGKVDGDIVRIDVVSLLLIATTGSFKTSALIIPTLFEFQGSSISTDIKSELWKKTHPYLKANGVAVHRWVLFGNGTEEDYTRINPFFYVPWESEKALNMLNLIVETLVPTLKGYQSIWEECSRDTIRAVALHLYLKNRNPNEVMLSEIVEIISKRGLIETLNEIYESYKDEPIYGTWLDVWLGKLLSVEDQRLKDSLLYSVQKDVASLFLPTVLRSMDDNDIDLRSLRTTPSAIFLDTPHGRSDEVKKFINLFYNVFMTVIAESGEPDKTEPYNILLNMEEFGDFGKINKLAQGANTYRAFGLRFIFVVQNTGQLQEHYGVHTAKTFLAAGAVIKDGDNNLEDNRYFSALLGDKITKKKDGAGDNRRTLTSVKPLMTADQIKSFSKNNWLLFLENENPVKLKKLWDKKDYKNYL